MPWPQGGSLQARERAGVLGGFVRDDDASRAGRAVDVVSFNECERSEPAAGCVVTGQAVVGGPGYPLW